MISLEQQYYENDAFWKPANISSEDEARIQKVADLLLPGTRSVLDVGCGNGICCNQLADLRPTLQRVVGFDRSEEAIKYVTQEKHIGDIADLPFADQEFDTVLSLEVLEHLPLSIYKAAIEEIARTARHQIVITVPARERLERNMAKCPSCSTRFSRSLHMRSFDDCIMRGMFDHVGFRNRGLHLLDVPSYVAIPTASLLYQRIRGSRYAMRQALCPVCGHSDAKTRDRGVRPQPPRWKSAIKQVWPRRSVLRWYLASYERA